MMATTDPKDLAQIFDARIKQIDAALAPQNAVRGKSLADASSLKAFGELSGQAFEHVTSLPASAIGSWIRGVPLPAMLAAKRRLTVDVTPETLADFGGSYNLSPDAFVAFAEAGLLLVNIRDYDPRGKNAEAVLRDYATADVARFLPKLFERAGDHIYFLATFRDNLFDPLFSNGGSLKASFDEAARLEPAAKAAAELNPYSELVRKAVFRNERPSLVAVRWHWAYAQATQRFSAKIDPEICGGLDKEFQTVASATGATAGADYLDLAVRLRYAHLLVSAPISASFGGTYNLLLDGEAEFLQAVRFGGRLADYDFVQDQLLDTIRSLQLAKLPPDLEKKIPMRYRATLRSAGVQAFVRYDDMSYLKHYENADNRKQLVDYVLEDDPLSGRYAKLAEEVDKLLADPAPKVGAIARAAAENDELALALGARLKRLTKAHQGIELPSSNLVSLATTPIYEANPKLANLVLRAGKVTERQPSIGGPDDVERRTYWYPKIFRRPPH